MARTAPEPGISRVRIFGPLAWGAPLLALLLAILAARAMRQHFGIDEFLYLHWGAEAAAGRYAGVDYFASHFPLLQFVLAPLFRFFDGSCVAPMLAARALAALCFLAASAAALTLVERPGARFLGALLLLSTDVLVVSAVEIRPDILSLALLAGGAALYLRSERQLPALLAGGLLGLAVLASEKALVHGVGFAAALLFAWIWALRRGRGAGELRRILCCCGAVAAVLAVALLALWRADGLEQARAWVEFVRLHETAYPAESFSRLRRAAELLLRAPHFALAPLGAWLLWRRARREPWKAEARRDLFVVAAGLASLLAVASQRSPYAYSWMPFLLFGGLWVLEAVLFLAAAIRRRLPRLSERGWRAAGAGLVLFLVIVECGLSLVRLRRASNADQLAASERICRLTAPGDCVYDNSAIAFSRRHADDRFVMTDAFMRFELRHELAARMPLAIRERECAVYIRDARAADLPRRLAEFLRAHYVPVGGDLSLWGTSYPPGRGAVRFDAVTAGEYYLWPPSARFASGAGTTRLPRGESALEVSAPEAFYLLWLPRDGVRLAPQIGAERQRGPFSLR